MSSIAASDLIRSITLTLVSLLTKITIVSKTSCNYHSQPRPTFNSMMVGPAVAGVGSDQLLRHLVPMQDFVSGFTTSQHISHKNIKLIVLEDAALGVHKITSRTKHSVVIPPEPLLVTDASASSQQPLNPAGRIPNPTSAWEAFYPKGSINPSGAIPGGFGFYLSGPQIFAEDLENASEVIFSYRMMLQEDWDWVQGGKLPGVCEPTISMSPF